MTTMSTIDTRARTSLGTRLLSLILVFSLLMMSMSALPVQAFAQSSNNSNDSGELDSSTIFSVASAASNYIDIMLVNGQASEVKNITVGNVAGGIGAIDTDSVKTLTNDSAVAEKSSDNVFTRAYTPAGSSSSDLEVQIAAYGRYGAALNYLGLDETAPEQTNDLFRMMSGRALQFFWFLSNGVDSLMGWACKILQALNPFGFLATSDGPFGTAQTPSDQFSDIPDTGYQGATNSTATGETWDDTELKTPDDTTGVGGVLKAIQDAFSSFWGDLTHLSWTVLMPLFLLLAVFAIVFGRAVDQNMYQKGRSQARRWVVRVIFLIAAVPVLGGIYTPILNGMTDSFLESENTTSVNADAVVASQLVDFQSWAQASHLSTEGLNISVTYADDSLTASSAPTDACMIAVRKAAATINDKWGNIQTDAVSTVASGSNASDVVLGLNTESGNGSVNSRTEQLGLSEDVHGRILSLMERYASGARYDSATFASNELQTLTGSGVNAAVVKEWRLITSDPANYAENLESSLQTTSSASNVEVKTRGFLGEDASADLADGRYIRINGAKKEEMATIIADLYKQLVGNEITIDEFRSKLEEAKRAEEEATSDTPGADNQADIDAIDWLRNGTLTASGSGEELTYSSSDLGLSTIGMYNYLSTVFATDGMHIYSAKETQNLPSRASHFSVTSVGTGTYGMLLMIDSIVVLMVFSLIGAAYALSMLFSNLKRGIQALISLPFAMLGVLNSMARVVMLILMMVIDLCTVFFLYQIVCQGIKALNDALTGTIANAATALSSTMIPADLSSSNVWLTASGGLGSVGLASLLLIIAIALMIGFMILALRIRRGVINVSNEMISRVVEKFFESRGGTDAKSNIGQKAATGAALGTSMAMRSGALGPAMAAGALGVAGGGALAAAKGSSAMAQGAANLTGAAGEDSSKAAGSAIGGLGRQAGGFTGGAITGTVSGDMSGSSSGATPDTGVDTSLKGADASASATGGAGTGGDASTATAATVAAMAAGGEGGAGVGSANADSASSAAGYGQGQGGTGASAVGLGAAASSAAFGGAGKEADGVDVRGVKADPSSQEGAYSAGMSTASYKSLGGQDSQYAPGIGQGTLGASVASFSGSEANGGVGVGGQGADGAAMNTYGSEADSSVYGVKAQSAAYSPLYGSVGAGSSEFAANSQANASGAGADSSAFASGAEGGYGSANAADGQAAMNGLVAGQAASASASASGGAQNAYGAGSEGGLSAEGSSAYAAGANAGSPLAVSASEAQGASASAEGRAQNQYGKEGFNSAEANAQAEEGLHNATLEANQEAPKGVQVGQPAVHVDAKSGDVSTGNLSGAVYDSSLGAGGGQQSQERMARAVEQGVTKASLAGAAGMQAAPGAPGASAPGAASGAAGAAGGAGAPGAAGGASKGVAGTGQTGLGTTIASSQGGLNSSNGIRGAKASPGGAMPTKTLGNNAGAPSGARANRAAAAAQHAEFLRKTGGAQMAGESFNSAPGAVKGMNGASGPAGASDLGSAVQQSSLSPQYGARRASGGGTYMQGSRDTVISGVGAQHRAGIQGASGYAPQGSAARSYGANTPLSESAMSSSPYGGGTSGASHPVYTPTAHQGAQGGTSLSADSVNSAMKAEDLSRAAAEERARQRSLEGSRFA